MENRRLLERRNRRNKMNTLAIICVFSILTNAILVSLSLKMYTEYFKDKAITNRVKENK